MLRLPRANPSARVVRPRERPGLIVFCRACRRSTPTSQHQACWGPRRWSLAGDKTAKGIAMPLATEGVRFIPHAI